MTNDRMRTIFAAACVLALGALTLLATEIDSRMAQMRAGDKLPEGRRLSPEPAEGSGELGLDTGVTSFMFLSTALVQLMTGGLGFFYSGMIYEKSANVLVLQSFVCLGLVFVIWAMLGFSLTFGLPYLHVGGYFLLGDPFTYFMLSEVTIYEPLQRAGAVVARGFPGMLFMAFQGMFAVITPALMTGAFVDRLRYLPYLSFIVMWHFLIYCPLAYWNWGGGWMFQIGAWDFAGGMVVHEAAGFSALGILLALGPRKRIPNPITHSPHNMMYVIFGTATMWFGWFGFNGGSALTIGGLATIAFINTQMAPAAAMLAWMVLDCMVPLKYNNRKPTAVGACAGVITGLVTITPSAGFVQSSAAILAGVIGVLVCWPLTYWNMWYSGLDDACFVFSIHGVGGYLGTILVGIISDPPVCQGDRPPSWCANPHTVARSMPQALIQLVCATTSALWCVICSYILIKAMKICGMKHLTDYAEQFQCQDWQQCGEVAYRRPVPEGAYDWVRDDEYGELQSMGGDSDDSSSEYTEKRSLQLAHY